jgi:hypothetical protein
VSTQAAAIAFLTAHGADRIEHPGGTLLAHLVRTAQRLESWQARSELVLAGLCHAAYGTDGFPVPLVELRQRATLAAVIGTAAEAIVYAYCASDRSHEMPSSDSSTLRDRFTGALMTPSAELLAAFVELTCANEIDVLLHSPSLLASAGPDIARLLHTCQPMASVAASRAIDEALLTVGLRSHHPAK